MKCGHCGHDALYHELESGRCFHDHGGGDRWRCDCVVFLAQPDPPRPSMSLTREQVEFELRSLLTGRRGRSRSEQERRAWLFSVLGWMDRNDRDDFLPLEDASPLVVLEGQVDELRSISARVERGTRELHERIAAAYPEGGEE